jgi:acyl dehydratase
VILLQAMSGPSSTPDLAAAAPVRTGRGFADFAPGDAYAHRRSRTVTEADVVLFASQTLAWDGLAGPRPAASPYLVLAIAVGLSVEDLSERSEAFLGMETVEFGALVHPGDTISAHSRVRDVRRSRSNPEQGIVTWDTEAHNQHGDLVVTLVRSNLFAIGDADAAD